MESYINKKDVGNTCQNKHKMNKFIMLAIGLFILISIISFTSATTQSVCGTINLAGDYVMNQSLSENNTNCITITANNVNFDCNDFTISANASNYTSGIYSTANYTTVRNCNMVDEENGVYFLGNNNGVIQNINSTTTFNLTGSETSGVYVSGSNNITLINIFGQSNVSTNGKGIYFYQTNNSFIRNSIGTVNTTNYGGQGIQFDYSYNNVVNNSLGMSDNGRGFQLEYYCSNNTITNSRGASNLYYGFLFETNSNYNTISNSVLSHNGASGLGSGIYFANSKYNTAINITGIGTGRDGLEIGGEINSSIINSLFTSNDRYGAYIQANAQGNILSNSNISSINSFGMVVLDSNNNLINNSLIKSDTSFGLYLSYSSTGSYRNIFRNNTYATPSYLVKIEAVGSENVFCLNNFTATSFYYVQDLNGSNQYNCSYDGLNQGNIYPNVLDNTTLITSSGYYYMSSIPTLFIGNGGVSYPYNATNSLNKLVGAIDWHPLTLNGVLTIPPTTLQQGNITINNPDFVFFQAFQLLNGLAGIIILIFISGLVIASWKFKAINTNQLIKSLIAIILSAFILGILLNALS